MTPPGRAPVLVIGVGDAYRGDDAAGPAVTGRLRALAPPGVEVAEHHGDPVSLMERWDQRERVYLVDAVAAGGVPGSVHRLDLIADPVPPRFGQRGSHGAGVAEAAELARALGRLPPQLTVYGIEGGSFALGAELSPGIRRAITIVCHRLRRELDHAVAHPVTPSAWDDGTARR